MSSATTQTATALSHLSGEQLGFVAARVWGRSPQADRSILAALDCPSVQVLMFALCLELDRRSALLDAEEEDAS